MIKFLNLKEIEGKILCVLLLFSIVISIVIIILSQILYYDGEISMSISAELIDNFITGYFMNFTKSSLPSNFDPSRESNDNLINFGIWQGTAKGCGKINDNGIKEARLPETGKNCEKDEEVLEPIPSTNIYSYKGIVISGSTKGEYYELLKEDIVKVNETCPQNKILCGYIDTLKNKLCINKTMTCPISYITISKTAPNIQNLHEIEGNDGYKLYFSNNPYPDGKEIPYIVNSFKIADEEI